MMFYVFLMMLSCGKVESKVETTSSNRKEDMTSEQQENDFSNIGDGSTLNQGTNDSDGNPIPLNNLSKTTDSKPQNATKLDDLPKDLVSDRIFRFPQSYEYEIRNDDINRVFPNVGETNLRDVAKYFYAKEEENWQNTKNLLKLPDFIRKTVESFAPENRQLVATWLLFNSIEIYLFANSKIFQFSSSNDFSFTKECIDILVDEYDAQVNVVYHDGKERHYLLNRFINLHIKHNLELGMVNKFLKEILKLKSRVPEFFIEDIVKKKDFRNPYINDVDVTLLKYALDNQKNDFKDHFPTLIQFSLNKIKFDKGLEAFKILFDAMLELNRDLNSIALKGYSDPAQSLFFQIIYKYLDFSFGKPETNYLEALKYVLSKHDWNILIYDGEDRTSYHSVLVEIGYILAESAYVLDSVDMPDQIDKLLQIILSNDYIKKALIKDNNQVVEKGVVIFGSLKEFIDDMLSANPKITIKPRLFLRPKNKEYYKEFGDRQKGYLRNLYESYNKYVSENR